MKALVIDSHKSSTNGPVQNLHWQNAKKIADKLDGDLIWSYPSVNDDIKEGYDAIVFVHASHYAYTDYAWLERSPDAKLFHVSNEYNLGEPRTLWMACKAGRSYTVIANHPPEPSKIVMKYVDGWNLVNLNALSYNYVGPDGELLFPKAGMIYYGSYRKGREKYFKKYLDGAVVSTHHSNHSKFFSLGIRPNFIPRIDWSGRGLSDFTHSLYIEDEVTHTHYNYLANRFYEALNYDCVPIFDVSCLGSIEKSNYDISDEYIIDGGVADGLPEFTDGAWHGIAEAEKKDALNDIAQIISGALNV
jgi:hypothetical protein